LVGTIASVQATLSAVTRLNDGRPVRSLRVAGATTGTFHRLLPSDGEVSSVLDAVTLTPLQSRYDAQRAGQRFRAEQRFRGRLVDTAVLRGGRRFWRSRLVEAHTADVLSWLVTLQARRLAPGETATQAVATRQRYLRMSAHAERVEEVSTPMGRIQATRVRVSLVPWWPIPALPRGQAHQPRPDPLGVVVWFDHGPFRLPVRLEMTVKVAGRMVVELTDRVLVGMDAVSGDSPSPGRARRRGRAP
jgi:hypothetical protein